MECNKFNRRVKNFICFLDKISGRIKSNKVESSAKFIFLYSSDRTEIGKGG